VRLDPVPVPVNDEPAVDSVALGYTFDRRFAVVDGLRVRYTDVGGPGDGDPLVIIPGHTARIEGYDALVALLVAGGHRVLVLDLPGCGGSDKPDRRYDLTFYEDVVVGFLDALGIATAVPVGGSLGGNLVLRLGHRFPDRFRRLVPWAPGGAWKARPGLARAVRAVQPAWRAMFWPTVWVQSRFWYRRDFPGRKAALAETFAYYREIMGPGFIKMYWGIVADLLATSLFDTAPTTTQPTILLWGDQDHGGGMGKGVARLHELLPDCRLHVFPGARHSVEAEIPDRLAEAILSWLGPPGDEPTPPPAPPGSAAPAS
jgi:pimeloyl-ACP methyl ester carboxylesterase